MKIHWFVFGVSLLWSSFGVSQELIEGRLDHDGLDRTWLTYFPSGYSASKPLSMLICMHGFTGSAENILQSSGFNDIAEEENFIVVYPQGSLIFGLSHWNVGNTGFAASDVDDVGFLNKMIIELSETYAVDSDRVYACGMSNGGFMSFRLACELSEKIAGIASVTGSMTASIFDSCDPQHQMPVLQMHGDADPIVPYLGDDADFVAVDDVMNFWRDYNECDTTAFIKELKDSDTSDGSTITSFSYGNGRNCSEVNHYLVNGGGHFWPGSSGNMDIDASMEIWNFLKEYDLNGLIGCSSTGDADLVQEDIKIYPNPTADRIYISGLEGRQSAITIMDFAGKLILESSFFNAEGVDVSNLDAGMYMLLVDDRSANFTIVR